MAPQDGLGFLALRARPGFGAALRAVLGLDEPAMWRTRGRRPRLGIRGRGLTTGGRFWRRGLPAPLAAAAATAGPTAAATGARLGEAIGAKHRTAWRRHEGHLGVLPARRALHVRHLPVAPRLAALPSAAFTPRMAAIGAARGFVVVAAFSEELLLSFTEHEGCAAITACEGFVGHFLLQLWVELISKAPDDPAAC